MNSSFQHKHSQAYIVLLLCFLPEQYDHTLLAEPRADLLSDNNGWLNRSWLGKSVVGCQLRIPMLTQFTNNLTQLDRHTHTHTFVTWLLYQKNGKYQKLCQPNTTSLHNTRWKSIQPTCYYWHIESNSKLTCTGSPTRKKKKKKRKLGSLYKYSQVHYIHRQVRTKYKTLSMAYLKTLLMH